MHNINESMLKSIFFYGGIFILIIGFVLACLYFLSTPKL